MHQPITAILLAGLLFFAVGQPTFAQDSYPSKPIRIVVPLPPGGAADGTARVLATALQIELKQPVIVENRAGNSGTLGVAYVAKAPPDGYTILLGSGSTNVIAPAMLKNVPYDPNNDFTPLAILGRGSFVIFTGPAMKGKSLAEVIATARANPGKISFGTIGAGTAFELAALQLESLADVKFNHIPYKGLGPLQIDVAGGVVDVAVGPINGFVKSDKLNVIVALGKKRSSELPNVPSAAELGYPTFDVPIWAGMWAPPGTPKAIVNQLAGAIRKAIGPKAAQEAILATGIEVDFGDDAELRSLVARDYEDIRFLMRKRNIEQQ